jgi:hypothetical protein
MGLKKTYDERPFEFLVEIKTGRWISSADRTCWVLSQPEVLFLISLANGFRVMGKWKRDDQSEAIVYHMREQEE